MTPREVELIQEKYADWLAHPITVALNQHLREQLQSLKDRWADGHFTSEDMQRGALLNANVIGQCEILTTLIDLQPEQFIPGAIP